LQNIVSSGDGHGYFFSSLVDDRVCFVESTLVLQV